MAANLETRKYEVIYFIAPNLSDEDTNAAVTKAEEFIKTLGGSVEKTERMGKRRLAFVMKKYKDAHQVLTHFELAANQITELKQSYKLYEPMIRCLITRKAS